MGSTRRKFILPVDLRGGREALECACSYGKDYDGIFCADPVSNFVLLRMWGALLSKAVYDSYDERIIPILMVLLMKKQ